MAKPTPTHRFAHSPSRRVTTWLLTGLMCTGTVAPLTFVNVSPAHAQSPQQMQEAREHFVQGRTHYENNDFLPAAEAFLRAYELSGRTELLYNIGQSYRLAEQLEQAEHYFQLYLTEQPDAANAEEVVELIIDIQQAIAARLATVHVETTPPGRSVYIDREATPRCTSPCSVSLQPGDYQVRIEDAGFEKTSQGVTVTAGEKRNIAITVKAAQAGGKLMLRTDVAHGVLRVAPGLERPLPLTEPVQLEAGTRTVEVQAGARGRWQGEVEIVADETVELFIPMQALSEAQASASPLKAVSYGLGGASVAFVTGAILLGMQANSTHEALAAQQQSLGTVNQALLDRGRGEQLGANILWTAGIASLVAGAGLYFWDWTRHREPAATESTPTQYPETDEPAAGDPKPADSKPADSKPADSALDVELLD